MHRKFRKGYFRWALTVLAAGYLAGFTASAFANAFNDPGTRSAPGGASAAGGAELTPVKPVVEGGQISVGSTAQVVLLFRNDSGHPLQVGAIQLYPSSTVSADVTSNQCGQDEMEAGSVCAVSLAVKGLQSGSWRVEALVRHNGRAKLATAAATGQVVATEGSKGNFVSDVQAIPDKLDFGDVISSQSVIKGVVFRNSTTQDVDVTSVYVEAAESSGFGVKTDCTHLASGQACMAIVTWSPVLRGQTAGILVLNHSGATKVTSVDMTGKFSPIQSEEAKTFPEAVPGKGLMVASQKEIDFGPGIDTTSAITVSLVNVGDAPLTIQDIHLANEENGLSISKKGCEARQVLAPVEACPLTLSWSPVREGAILDDVQVVHDGTRGVLVLPVKGSAAGAVSQDSKAIKLAGSGTGTLSPSEDVMGKGGLRAARADNIDPASVLDGFTVTSHSTRRAIIAGPGGSRIVASGQELVLGGFVWHINIRPSGVEFSNGHEKVLLLFDRSLASTRSGGATASSAVAAPARTAATAPASPPATTASTLSRTATTNAQ